MNLGKKWARPKPPASSDSAVQPDDSAVLPNDPATTQDDAVVAEVPVNALLADAIRDVQGLPR